MWKGLAICIIERAVLIEKAYSVLHRQDYPNPLLGESLPLYSEWRPTEWLKGQIAANETRIQALTGEIEDRNAYYIGRCGGDVLTGLIGFAESFLGSSMTTFGASTLAAEAASGAGLVLAPGSMAMVVGGVLIAVDGATETAYAVQMLGEDIGRYRESKAEEDSEGGLDSIHNLDDLLTNPDKLFGISVNELYDYLMKNGYDVQPLSRGSLKGIPFEEGGGFKVNWGGDRILQYHPENLSHHGGAYFKISSGKTGTIRIDLGGNIIE